EFRIQGFAMWKNIKFAFTFSLSLFLLIACSQGAANQSPSIVEEEFVPIERNVEVAEVEPEPVELAAVYSIIPGESVARFELDEDLRSADTGWGAWTRVTVLGDTDQVFGDIAVNADDLASTQLVDIKIDANTFYTNEPVRRRKIQTQILETEIYPFITFQPTGIREMPETVQLGEEIAFMIDGDLTIRTVSLPQTFEVTAVLASPDEIVGTAAAVVTRQSYGIEIPGVPNIADVEDEVELYIDFVARATN
ncbi:MAG: YceI family protein, partial [Chloroflexota bacterium]